MKESYVYIITNKRNGTLYIGVISNLIQRIQKHRLKIYKGFSQKYNLDILVYYEIHFHIKDAILREKQLKKWNRDWKIRLIEETNPCWDDLYLGFPPSQE